MRNLVLLFLLIALFSCQKDSEALTPFSNDDLDQIITAYLTIQKELAFDDNSQINQHIEAINESVIKIDRTSIHEWQTSSTELKQALALYKTDLSLHENRAHFQQLTRGVIKLVQQYGFSQSLYVMKCPMAFDNKGATWLQSTKDLINPYFGSEMFKCGNVLKQLNSGTES